MEIKDPIHGAIHLGDGEIEVLDSREFQRLRAIKQLGFAEYSFPGATHNRYIHSVGVCHLAGRAFDSIFRDFKFSSPEVRARLRQATRLGALLHDIGHGPLSHTTEEVMPKVGDLKVREYGQWRSRPIDPEQKATHEDYTIKFITDSPLTDVMRSSFPGMSPHHVACLIDRELNPGDDFFVDQGLDLRPVLSQVISSEMDVDRMDYLERDAYFCGTNYGRVELGWLIGNLACHISNDKVYLALNRRALYTFDDFLISRHHMYLMVYFHHKSIIYEEMLHRYLTAPDCSYFLPASVDDYIKCTDYSLYEHLSRVSNPWAQRIAARRPYRMLLELHTSEGDEEHSSGTLPGLELGTRAQRIQKVLEGEGIEAIYASSKARLSKYHATQTQAANPIYVVDHYDPMEKPVPIENCTRIFQKYEEARVIERLYVAEESFAKARLLLVDRKI